MGFFDYLFDNDYKQRDDIEGLKSIIYSQRNTSNSSEKELSRLSSRISILENNLGTMALFVKAMKTLLDKKGMWSDEEFMAMCREIDQADGVEDGKTTIGGEEVINKDEAQKRKKESYGSHFLDRK